MKKIINILLVSILMLGVISFASGCWKKNDSSSSNKGNDSQQEAEVEWPDDWGDE